MKLAEAQRKRPLNPLPERKYDYKAVRAFYDACKSYKKTRAQFGITNSATLHYILKSR